MDLQEMKAEKLAAEERIAQFIREELDGLSFSPTGLDVDVIERRTINGEISVQVSNVKIRVEL